MSDESNVAFDWRVPAKGHRGTTAAWQGPNFFSPPRDVFRLGFNPNREWAVKKGCSIAGRVGCAREAVRYNTDLQSMITAGPRSTLSWWYQDLALIEHW